MRLTPEQRSLIGKAVDRTNNKSLVARVFGVTRKTVDKWNKRRKQTKDRKRKKKKSKINVNVELFILALRTVFEWGTERIQKGLYSLPDFMLGSLEKLKVKPVQKISLSRASINDVLKKHGLNGYKKKSEGWKFFRAKKPDELWQLDIKGLFKVKGKKYWFLICIDDYSRYIILAEQLSHAPSIREICKLLKPYVMRHRPKKILTDNNPFKEEWDNWCKSNGVEALHAHPYYPQDKGKVERSIRNIAEEFVYLLKKFPQWLKGKIKDYQKWFNTKRFHRGINTVPKALYT
jgi:transposase InsO family protein